MSGNFYFSFVSTSVAYIAIPRNKGKIKTSTSDKKLTRHMYGKVLTAEICSQSCTRKKSPLAWTGAAWNRKVMMTFLLFMRASKRWLGWRKTENARRDRLGWLCDTHCRVILVILRYSFAHLLLVTFCGAAVLKVINQKTIVKCGRSYKVRITVYVLRLGEFARHSFSLFGGKRLSPQTSKTGESTASLSPAERWTITEIRRQLNS